MDMKIGFTASGATSLFTKFRDLRPPKKRSLRGRRLVVVDIENLARGAVRTGREAAEAQRLLQEAVGLNVSDHVVIGTSHIGIFPTADGWCGPRPRILAGSGRNGADMVLLEVLTGERIEERFDEVVLASGDGIFTDSVAALGASGVRVTVVAHAGGCARRLRLVSARTVLINCSHVLGGVA